MIASVICERDSVNGESAVRSEWRVLLEENNSQSDFNLNSGIQIIMKRQKRLEDGCMIGMRAGRQGWKNGMGRCCQNKRRKVDNEWKRRGRKACW
jgi:hypothetical protein